MYYYNFLNFPKDNIRGLGTIQIYITKGINPIKIKN